MIADLVIEPRRGGIGFRLHDKKKVEEQESTIPEGRGVIDLMSHALVAGQMSQPNATIRCQVHQNK